MRPLAGSNWNSSIEISVFGPSEILVPSCRITPIFPPDGVDKTS